MKTNGGHYRVAATFLLSLFLRQMHNLIVITGQKRDLASNEKSTIVSELGNGKTTIEI